MPQLTALDCTSQLYHTALIKLPATNYMCASSPEQRSGRHGVLRCKRPSKAQTGAILAALKPRLSQSTFDDGLQSHTSISKDTSKIAPCAGMNGGMYIKQQTRALHALCTRTLSEEIVGMGRTQLAAWRLHGRLCTDDACMPLKCFAVQHKTALARLLNQCVIQIQ